MKILTISREEFDNYSINNKYNTYYQSPEYAEFKRVTEGYDVSFLGFYDDDKNLVGAAMFLYKVLFWKYKYAYAPRGILMDYEDDALVKKISTDLRRLLSRQRFIFVKIDPPIVASERDVNGNIINFNSKVNEILSNFKHCNYEHLGFNLYDESLLPRWNVIAKLKNDARIIFNNFDSKIKEQISYANSMAISVVEDETVDIDRFYDFLRKSNIRKNKKYFMALKDAFYSTKKIKIFYAYIDTNKYTINANKLYASEEEKNNILSNIIRSGDSVKYNIQKAVSDKVISDRYLNAYKRDVIESTKLLKKFPGGITCGCSLCIEEAKGANVLINFEDAEYNKYHVNALLNYEMMKYFGKKNLEYLNLGSITGNFNPNSKYYRALLGKVGFNSTIIEYVGEFDLIVSKFMYKIYKKKYKK